MGKLDTDIAPTPTTADADAAPPIRVPDEGALPVATFSEEDFRKHEPELPSARWRRRASRTLVPALLAACLSAIGLGILGRTPGFEGVGLMTILCAPLIIGTVVSLFPVDEKAPTPTRRKSRGGSVSAGVWAAMFVCVAAMPLVGEGFICIAMAMPFMALFSAGAATLANDVVDRHLARKDARFRAGLMAILTLVIPLACSAIDQTFFFDATARSTISSSVTVPASRAEVWASLRHLDVTFESPSPWSIESVLPVPVAIRGDGASPGAKRRVVFDNGTVVARVTDLVPEQTYAIDLQVEPAGREFFDHWIDLKHSRFDLVDEDGGTTLIHTTTYRPLMFPRVAFEPLEQVLGGLIQGRLVDVYARQVLAPRRSRSPEHLARAGLFR